MMRKIIRSFYRNILPLRVRNSVDIFKDIRSRNASDSCQTTKEDLKEKNILVLSPHPDDDIIGCGGSLNIYRQNGAAITVVYMTDGRKGNHGYNEDTLVIKRKEEAEQAAKIIGIEKLIFLDNRDGELSSESKTIEELTNIFKDFQPEIVFLPFLLDNHPDHIATNEIFVRATRDYDSPLSCYGYEVWTPIAAPNCIIDISDEFELKKKAVEQHHSQLENLNFIGAVTGLAKYRSVLHNLKDGYAEAFVRCDAREYRRLWQAAY